MPNTFVLARVLHVLGVVIWIGGVAMVTMVILPAIRRFEQPERRVEVFEAIEGRFARIAKVATVIVGLTGFYMVERMNAWALFGLASHWWLPGMVAVWLLFTLVLFVLEPLFLHRWFHEHGQSEPERTFKLVQIMHWVLLAVSLTVIVGVVAGSHGWFLF
ncbi:MAG: hypothetical protein JKY61_12495 [Planctomycetes bacterium]|nr:hypothetical protein [Planctomycetota bacterium]